MGAWNAANASWVRNRHRHVHVHVHVIAGTPLRNENKTHMYFFLIEMRSNAGLCLINVHEGGACGKTKHERIMTYMRQSMEYI